MDHLQKLDQTAYELGYGNAKGHAEYLINEQFPGTREENIAYVVSAVIKKAIETEDSIGRVIAINRSGNW